MDGSTIGAGRRDVRRGYRHRHGAAFSAVCSGRTIESMAPDETPKTAGAPQCHKRLLGAPIRLGDDADPKTMGLQPTPQQRHPKGRVVNIGIAADQDHIQLLPAPATGLLQRRG